MAANSSFFASQQKFAAPKLHILNVGLQDASLSYIFKKVGLARSIGVGLSLHLFVDRLLPQASIDTTLARVQKNATPDNLYVNPCDFDQPQKCYDQVANLIEELNRK